MKSYKQMGQRPFGILPGVWVALVCITGSWRRHLVGRKRRRTSCGSFCRKSSRPPWPCIIKVGRKSLRRSLLMPFRRRRWRAAGRNGNNKRRLYPDGSSSLLKRQRKRRTKEASSLLHQMDRHHQGL